MNGVINIYKEKGCTSFSAAARLRKITGERKTGHTGTLDPDACGVLPVCLGKATKLVGLLADTDKEYRTQMIFGTATDTLDISGTVLKKMDLAEAVRRLESKEKIIDAIKSFEGDIYQLPPMYSAVKVGGVKLVDAARKGQEIERKPRPVTIYGIPDIEIADDLLSAAFTVNCSKGTYIRTLCADIGGRLGVPACMKELERTRACGFSLEGSHTLSEVEEYKEAGRLGELIIPADSLLTEYAALTVGKEAVKRLVFGNFMYFEDFIPDQKLKIPGTYRIYDENGMFYGLYKYNEGERFYRCRKMLTEQELPG